MNATVCGLALAALLLSCSSASAQSTPAAGGPADPRLTAAIVHALQGAVRLTIFDDVNAQVDGDRVILTGKVTMPFKRSDVERRIAKVPGVRAVQNDIAVLPVSRFDDELRYRIARAIYGNPSFWNYASMPNPPIHIIVEDGRVTLTGIVNNSVERALARSLATGLGALSVTTALRTDAEVKID